MSFASKWSRPNGEELWLFFWFRSGIAELFLSGIGGFDFWIAGSAPIEGDGLVVNRRGRVGEWIVQNDVWLCLGLFSLGTIVV